jgi:competence protein ComEC
MADSQLEIVVWNVEHGSAIYAKTPNGRHILMDAGASSTFSPASWLKELYDIDRAHLFILSHADTDHIRDIESVDKLLNPRTFLRNRTAPTDLIYPTYPPTTNPLKHFLDFDSRYTADLPEDSPYRLRPESNWGGVRINTFYNTAPDKEFKKLNDYSVATFLLYGNLEFLFPGDLEEPGWKALMGGDTFRRLSTPSSSNKDEVRILVAAHHGRAVGVYKPFLELYQPHLTIMSEKYGTEYSDYTTYYAVSQGYSVYDKKTKKAETRYVLSTKVKDFVLILADASYVSVGV